VDTDDFRAIARSALAGRSCVLNDALGKKAAAKYAEGLFAPALSTHAANTVHGGTEGGTDGGSEKSFDMFE
jgi:hypothetical protein